MDKPTRLTDIFDEIVDTSKRKRAGRPSEKRDREELILRLKDKDTFVVRTILQANFDDAIVFPFPSGEPPYVVNNEYVEVSDKVLGMLGYLVKGAKGTIGGKEMLFVKLLEKVNVEDAQLICLAKDGKLEDLYPTITEDIVKEVWPKIFGAA